MMIKYQEQIGMMPTEMRNCISRAMVIQESYDRWSISEDRAPSDAMREAMKGRRESIRRCLSPASHVEIAECISGLLILYQSRVGEAEASKIVAGYVAALQGLPLWAIRQTCDAFSSGRAGNANGYRPSVDQLAKVSRALLGPLQEESLQLYKLLKAKVIRPVSGEEREVISTKFKDLLAELKEMREDKPENEEYKAWSERRHEEMRKREFSAAGMEYAPNKLGPAGIQSLGLQTPREILQASENEEKIL